VSFLVLELEEETDENGEKVCLFDFKFEDWRKIKLNPS
jgi:hypothetical protein